MKMNVLAIAVLAGMTVLTTACGEDKSATKAAPAPAAQESNAQAPAIKELTTEEQKISYAVGASFGGFFSQISKEQSKYIGEIDKNLVIQGFVDSLDSKSLLTDDQIRTALEGLDAKVREGLEKEQAQISSKNLEEGKKFLEENAKKEGVKVTSSGLQYIVEKEGTGKTPALTDSVKVIYKGTTIDGTVFDEQTEPVEFPLSNIIPGWTEGLQLMKEGGKMKFFIPSELAYGESGAGAVIPPNSVLLFDVELVEVVGKEAPEQQK